MISKSAEKSGELHRHELKGERMNILLVDDNQENLTQLRPLLEADGNIVFDAGDGVQALAVLEKEKVDAVVSETVMPRMNGYRLCYEVRKNERFKDLPFIICTDKRSSFANEKDSLEVGADLYIQRTGAAEVILEALKRASSRTSHQRLQPLPENAEWTRMREYNEWLIQKLEQKNGELQSTHERLRRLLAHIPAVIYVLRMEGNEWTPLVVSESIQTMLGFTVEETLEPGWHAGHLHPEDGARVRAALQKTPVSTATTEFRMLHKDGNYRWVEDSKRLLRAMPGEAGQAAGLWVDITERKTSALALEQSEQRFAKAFHASPSNFAICTYPEGFYVDVNEHFTETLGYSRDEVIGRSGKDLGIWGDPEQSVEIFESIRKNEEVREVESVMRGKSGALFSTCLSVERIDLGSQACLLFMNYDFTRRKKAEEELRVSEKRFRQLAENVAEVFWVSNKDFTEIQYVNPAYEKIWGRTCQSFYDHPMSFSEAVHPQDYEKFLKMLEKQKRGEARRVTSSTASSARTEQNDGSGKSRFRFEMRRGNFTG